MLVILCQKSIKNKMYKNNVQKQCLKNIILYKYICCI